MPSVDQTLVPAVVKLSDVSFRYGDVAALAGVNLQVAPGSITALIGRNGAGKTTIVNLLSGLLEPDQGAVTLLGRGWTDGSRDVDLRRETGFLLSDDALFQYLTVGETLAFLAAAYDLEAGESRTRVAELLQFFDLESVRDRLTDQLSTGTRKRLALAAAMVHAPRVLVLDEPFEALDPLIVRRLRRLLVQYVRRGGSVLLSSHLVGVVQEISDYVYILEQGRIIFEGAGAQFRTREAPLPDDGGGALETMYASLVDNASQAQLDWL